ncbi:hypothetical protein [Cryptosporidium parvum Iowa II]|uniref:Snurportin-1 n=2 Tax=Cryptosporidium parvum TaxID=5807 RepID=Q5CUQ2_CRYPI|nr:hypothetical protein [Cryptosporidium parvum Iowa II]EAK89106.1 hypothetical protein cgd3_1910 [Cryptosporidium parvum Iowa II]QOY42540.1 Uncharacterized protein CPATCC_0032870 [Cryptosporidium parvum]WKS76933.1 hypothetical protein CPCDC_3g1910 [Cryptosporidium sp. 43IA8]WRK31425.1 Uncharacterized protein cpbgf_3001910 [Cryptosporidium parvum]|eukprot:QOY42540.1 hypothetical protein CPATCC_001187 [Cryptosporidium parvum]
MNSSYNSYYKLNHGFIKEKHSDMSSIDKKLRGMLEKLRTERRQKFLKFQRTEDKEYFKPKGKSEKVHSKFIKDWKLSKVWSKELIEYTWLSKLSEGYKSIQENPQDWLLLPICTGSRSMLIQGNGYCELRNQDGWRIFTVKNVPFAHTGLTIIDGIYNQDQNTFYCNDLIVWNNLNICISTTECRLHFLSSRIEESGVTNRTAESMDVSMVLDSNLKLIPNIRIQLGKYFPLSKDSLLHIYGVNDRMHGPLSDFDCLVFVRKDSVYDVEQDYEDAYPECKEYCTASQKNWFIWRDKQNKSFKDCRDKEMDDNTTFKLNINEKNELYTKDKVLIGKVRCSGTLTENLSLDNDQKILLNEFGIVFVKVKFETENILNLLNIISSRCLNSICGNNYSKSENIFELSNVSIQDKFSCKLDSSDYIFFKCIEFITETKYSSCMIPNESNLNLNVESLLNSIS